MLLRALGNLVRLFLWPYLAWRRARVVPPGTFVHVTIDGAVADLVPEPRFWEQWRPQPTSLWGIGKVVDAVLKDPHVRGVLVTVRSLRGGMATATSLRAVLGRVRAAGREVVVHLPLGADTKETYVASVATRVYLGPQAVMTPIGFAASVRYGKRALGHLGVEPEVFARGRFKSAAEPLVRDAMSDAQREQLGALLDEHYRALVDALVSGRGLTPERAAAVIDGAPYLAHEAVAAGIADGGAYEDQLPDLLTKDGVRPRIVESDRYVAVTRPPLRRVRSRPVVGVIRVHGAIASQSTLFQAGATDERVIAAVRRARANPKIAAVVLHVDSPGGGALASDRIHHELEQLAAEKPLVACFANVAASGGYYVAAAAHSIVAQPTTVTGSIGVIAARFVLGPLLDRLGVTTEVLKRGAHADAMQPNRHFTPEERAAYEREIEGMYQAFVGIVARGRKRSVEDIERVAQGRVWSGADAAREGLVDELGGFDTALARARTLAAARIGEAQARGLEPVLVRGARHAPPPLDPPRAKAARATLAALAELASAAGIDGGAWSLAGTRERVLAWSEDAAQLGAGDPHASPEARDLS